MKNKLILGTVQFGLNYGISNTLGKPSSVEVYDILDEAFSQGIFTLDTADAYGNAIDLIGSYHKKKRNLFKILSKFKNVKKDELIDSIRMDLDKLSIESFEAYSYHSFSEFIEKPFLIDELNKAKHLGLIKKIGISVYSNDEFHKSINFDSIDIIQLPYNLLDNKNIRGYLLQVAKERNKEIHVRSVFLQGLLFKDPQSLPKKLFPLKQYIEMIKQITEKESITKESLALSYPLYNKFIDNVLIGVDTKEQLIQNVNSIVSRPDIFKYIDTNINVKEIHLLNPVNW